MRSRRSATSSDAPSATSFAFAASSDSVSRQMASAHAPTRASSFSRPSADLTKPSTTNGAGFPAIPATSSSIIIGDGTIFPCLIIAASSLPVCVSAVTSSLSSFCCERYVPPHFCAISAHAASAPDAALPKTSTTGPSVTVVGPLLAGAVVVDGTDAGGGGAGRSGLRGLSLAGSDLAGLGCATAHVCCCSSAALR